MADKWAELLKVLASSLRLRILALCLDKERTSRELRETLNLSKPLLIMHLRKLVNAGFLEYRTELDKTKVIVRKYYKTKDLKLCIDTDLLREISKELKQIKS